MFQFVHEVEDVAGGSPQPIELDDDQRVPRPDEMIEASSSLPSLDPPETFSVRTMVHPAARSGLLN